MSAVDQIRQRHAEELRAAEAEQNRAVQLTPEQERAAKAEGLRIVREAREAEVRDARPISELDTAEVRARLVAAEATIERLEASPRQLGIATGHLTAAHAQAVAEFDQQFSPAEFLSPVPADRFIELAALWAAGSESFLDAISSRIRKAYPRHNPSIIDPDLYEALQSAIPLRSEVARRERETVAQGKHKGRRFGRRAPSAPPSDALDADSDLGFRT